MKMAAMAYKEPRGAQNRMSAFWQSGSIRSITRSRLELPDLLADWLGGRRGGGISAHWGVRSPSRLALGHGFPTLRLRLRAWA